MIRINPDMGYLKVAREQERQIEKSRRLHERLAQCDKDLRELDDNPFIYTVSEVNHRRNAILKLRQQTRDEIDNRDERYQKALEEWRALL